ncbi:hypothetical protein [Catellatospora sichuanensis]|uniref:hypothetical protein n=1 Tax=Catellatospora sichuanensis TaxID=1969805 RepID=UPI0011836C4F|nr:hypothetical protein [Catellatospora sichuanensis]
MNSAELINRLRVHAGGDFDVAWVGEGWRCLVGECHEQLAAAFPTYVLVNVEQKHGVLSFQALPHPRVEGQPYWSSEQSAMLEAITDEFTHRSESVCEWCSAAAELRGWRRIELTLCEECDRRFPDPPGT